MVVRTVLAGAAVAAALVGAAPSAFASSDLTVQLNAAGGPSGPTNTFQFTASNTAYGNCPGGHGVFSSPVLLFGSHQYGPSGQPDTNVRAAALLRPGIVAGAYKLTMTCGDESVSTTITVPDGSLPPHA